MNKTVKCVKITPDGNMTEINNRYEDKDWKDMRGRDGYALHNPEAWGYKLTIYMLDCFDENDPFNKTASLIYNTLQHGCMQTERLRGTVFIMNEDSNGCSVDFTVKELNEIIYKACMPKVLGLI